MTTLVLERDPVAVDVKATEDKLIVHLAIEGLLAGRQSGESQKSIERWLAARHK